MSAWDGQVLGAIKSLAQDHRAHLDARIKQVELPEADTEDLRKLMKKTEWTVVRAGGFHIAMNTFGDDVVGKNTTKEEKKLLDEVKELEEEPK